MATMHKYLRSIGLSGLQGRAAIDKLLKYCANNADKKEYFKNKDGEMIAHFSKELAPGMGLTICGEFYENNRFQYEYYFPYIKGLGTSSNEKITAERHSSEESYAGICDDPRLGITMIFYLQNMIPYLKHSDKDDNDASGSGVTLSALSEKGSVLFPIAKTPVQSRQMKRRARQRTRLISSARNGDENAIESLTMDDMEIYSAVSSRLPREDILTLVDSYFMPTGVECDQYAVLGEITDFHLQINNYTKEPVYILSVICNGMEFEIGIAKKDLLGEPAIGRRFKGKVWLQGSIDYTE
jgi:hypothetical protein